MSISTNEFRQMMRLHPAAVTIIATGSAPNRTGLTATAFMSLSADPVSIVCAVNRAAFTYVKIAENRSFSVNTLASQQIDLAKLFSGQTDRVGEGRFDTEDWTTLESGAPVLKDAVMSLDCELLQTIDSGTHSLLIGRVLAGKRTPEHAPLIYVDGNWASVAMDLMAA